MINLSVHIKSFIYKLKTTDKISINSEFKTWYQQNRISWEITNVKFFEVFLTKYFEKKNKLTLNCTDSHSNRFLFVELKIVRSNDLSSEFFIQHFIYFHKTRYREFLKLNKSIFVKKKIKLVNEYCKHCLGCFWVSEYRIRQ